MRSRLLALSSVLLLTLPSACGDDDGDPQVDAPPVVDFDASPEQPDANVPRPDADVGPGPCEASELVDLNAITPVDGVIVFDGDLPAGPGHFTPPTECADTTSLGEVAHKYTAGAHMKIRATTEDGTTVDTVLSVRSACENAGSTVACNDDIDYGGGVYQSALELDDVASGETVYFIVDVWHTEDTPAPYRLTLTPVPFLAAGADCDPTGVENECETGLTCSMATVAAGSPTGKCATPEATGPTIANVGGHVLENGHGLDLRFTGHDGDGDVLEAVTQFLDAEGNLVDLNEDGTPDEFRFATVPALPGTIDIDATIPLRGVPDDVLPLLRTARIKLVDAPGRESTPVDGAIYHPTFVGAGAACNGTTEVCSGEMTCATTCAEPAASVAACAAVEAGAAAVAYTGIETTPFAGTVTIGATDPDLFQGTCFWNPGLPEQVRKVTIGGTKHVQMTVDVDLASNPSGLDTYVYLRTACDLPTSEAGCNDDASGSTLASTLVARDLAPGTYYVFVDGSSSGGDVVSSGAINYEVSFAALKDPDEACLDTDLCWDGYICYDGGTGAKCTALADIVGPMCDAAPAIVFGTPITGQLPLTGLSLFEGTCSYYYDYYFFPEKLHALTLANKAEITATTGGAGTSVDTVVYVLDACDPGAAEVACNDDIASADWRSELVEILDAGTYTLVVEPASDATPDGAATATDPASYSLTVTKVDILGAGASCDTTGVTNRCDTGLACSGTPATCQ